MQMNSPILFIKASDQSEITEEPNAKLTRIRQDKE